MPRTSPPSLRRRAEAAPGRRSRSASPPPLVALVALVASAAPRSKATTVTLGSTSTMPDPSCPDLPCQAVGSVTGFQVSNDQTQSPFLVKTRRHDQVLDADPGPADQQPAHLLQRLLRHPAGGAPGDPPPRPRHQPAALHLRAQGAIKVLSPYLGQTVKFGASLKVEKGDIIGITVPTWAPIFSQGLERRATSGGPAANRAPAPTRPTSARAKPQETVGKRATYGCKYSTARLLYTATLVEGK